MEYAQHIPKTLLARKTRQVLQSVQRGQTAIVENHGQPEAAIIDIIDYHIVRAVLRYHANPAELDPEAGLSDSKLEGIDDLQARFDIVLAHYLGQVISLGRAAELLNLAWVDLRFRFSRLDVPLYLSPETMEEAQAEIDAILSWNR